MLALLSYGSEIRQMKISFVTPEKRVLSSDSRSSNGKLPPVSAQAARVVDLGEIERQSDYRGIILMCSASCKTCKTFDRGAKGVSQGCKLLRRELTQTFNNDDVYFCYC